MTNWFYVGISLLLFTTKTEKCIRLRRSQWGSGGSTPSSSQYYRGRTCAVAVCDVSVPFLVYRLGKGTRIIILLLFLLLKPFKNAVVMATGSGSPFWCMSDQQKLVSRIFSPDGGFQIVSARYRRGQSKIIITATTTTTAARRRLALI